MAIATTGLGTILLATSRAASRSSSKGASGAPEMMQSPALWQGTMRLARTIGSSSSSHRKDSVGKACLLLLLLLALPAVAKAVVMLLVACCTIQCQLPRRWHPLDALLTLQLQLLQPREAGLAAERQLLVLPRAAAAKGALPTALLLLPAQPPSRVSRLWRHQREGRATWQFNRGSRTCQTSRMRTAL